MHTHVSYAWSDPTAQRQFTSGVSLHSHTSHSRETLIFIDDLGRTIPLLNRFIRWQGKRAHRAGFAMDFSRGYWTPPLTPQLALDVERNQLSETLELVPIVSLTDHDSIAAPTLLNSLFGAGTVPISFEWTVPFDGIAFHLGVHNLPPRLAPQITSQLASYTALPTREALRDLLSTLHGLQHVLLVFNHPLWNLYRAPRVHFDKAVDDFMRACGPFIHAMELNGLRAWPENRAVVDLSAAWRKPLVSGGDRHGAEPNGNVNLTNAEDFAAFVCEIRTLGLSHILFMPQYRRDQRLRCFRTFADVVRHNPELPVGAQNWDERVFHPDKGGVDRPLAALWKRPPKFLE